MRFSYLIWPFCIYIYILYMYNIIYYCIYYALYIIYIATPLHYIHNVKTIFGKSLGHGGWISQYLQPFVRFLVHEGFPDFFAQDTVLRTMSVEVDWKSIAAAPPLIASALQQSTVGKFPRRQMSVQLAFLCIFEPEPVLMMQRMHCTLLCSFSPSLAFCQKQFLLRIFAGTTKFGEKTGGHSWDSFNAMLCEFEAALGRFDPAEGNGGEGQLLLSVLTQKHRRCLLSCSRLREGDQQVIGTHLSSRVYVEIVSPCFIFKN